MQLVRGSNGKLMMGQVIVPNLVESLDRVHLFRVSTTGIKLLINYDWKVHHWPQHDLKENQVTLGVKFTVNKTLLVCFSNGTSKSKARGELT